MNTWHTAPHYTAAQLARLHEEARERAHALRAEAMDNFWRDVGEVVVASGRAAVRLAHRLQRHAATTTRQPDIALPPARRMPAVEA